MLVDQFISSIIQLVAFSLIPFIWWCVTARAKESFLRWLGFVKPQTDHPKALVWLVSAGFIATVLLGGLQWWLTRDVTTAYARFEGLGMAGIPGVMLMAGIQTSLSEEILFRGFLLKRLMSKLGFPAAAVIQAILFGFIHLAFAWGQVGIPEGIAVVVYPMIPALIIAYINEKKAGGSILPGWIIHGTANAFYGLVQLF
jgi:membrane protease YdiL (CAAX protease family)